MKIEFGTDGVRGIAGEYLTVEAALRIGQATAKVLDLSENTHAKVFIGQDTRQSGDMLGHALAAGLSSMGVHVEFLGVVPTPAVAYLTAYYGMDAGVMISASHNPAEYNGIKIFGGTGFKIADEAERKIENLVNGEEPIGPAAIGIEMGEIRQNNEAVRTYTRYIASVYGDELLWKKHDINEDGGRLRVLVDCANGSASRTAADIFHQLPIYPEFIHMSPDGKNINLHCGSLHVDDLGRQVVAGNFDVGIAFDGDADRIQVVDEKGNLIDGDQLMAIFAEDMQRKGTLKQGIIVGTVMSNLGLFHFASKNGLEVIATKVGDRYVLEEMEQEGYNLGGEQSGHIILRDYHTTGDGQLAASRFLRILSEQQIEVSALASIMEKYPQILENLRISPEGKEQLETSVPVQARIEEWSERLGDRGRVLVRKSGTEPLVRVMAEGQDLDEIRLCVDEICQTIKENLQ